MLLTPCAPTPRLFLSSIYTGDDISRDHLHDRDFKLCHFLKISKIRLENDPLVILSFRLRAFEFELDDTLADNRLRKLKIFHLNLVDYFYIQP